MTFAKNTVFTDFLKDKRSIINQKLPKGKIYTMNKLLFTLILALSIILSPATYSAIQGHSKPSILTTKRPSGLSSNVATLAFNAHETARQRGFTHSDILTIIDYSLPSTAKRLWVVDLRKNKMIVNTVVSHGAHTGDLYARSFSDQPGTHKTSIGVYVTDQTYSGSHGISLRLKGLERGFNANAYSRAIVVHGARYVGEGINMVGRGIGRSWGCPAIPAQIASSVINTIKGGSVLVAYYPDKKWLTHSQFIRA